MLRNKRNSLKSGKLRKSKSQSKIPSKKNSRKSINFFNMRLSNTKLKKILVLQRMWKKYYKNKIEKKIVKIQSVFRSYKIREIFNEVFILNKKLECFFFIIKITMFRHAIKYDYLANKRIDYYSDHKNTKYFLLLQRRIRYFLFMKKIKVLDKLGIFNDIYIKTKEYRTKINSKMTSDKYLSKSIYKYHKPLSKIIMIQRNYLAHAKIMRKLNKQKINKLSLNKCPLITKEERYLNNENIDIYKNLKNKVAINKKDFYTKINYDYKPLIFIQQQYKERFKYLKENYKLKKHSKLLKKVNNKHHYIYHCIVNNAIYEVLLIQKNIKYFLYRRHSMINLLHKMPIKKCEIKKEYEARGNVKKYFYEEFVRRLIIIIKRFFLTLYLKILKKNLKKKKIASFGLSDYNYLDSVNSRESSNNVKRRNSLKSEAIKNIRKQQQQKKSTRKETFSVSPTKVNQYGKQSNLISSSDLKNSKERNQKKKVTFKSDMKLSKKIIKNDEPQIFDSPSKNNPRIKAQSSKGFPKHKTQNFTNQGSLFQKGK